MIIILFISQLLMAENQQTKKFSYSKTPKSLFLIKKAKVDADVGEPNLLLSEHQRKDILSDERFMYKP